MNEHGDISHVESSNVRQVMTDAAEAERSAFAVHRDPSLARPGAEQSRVGRGIAWMRPSDLIASGTARIAGRGISLQAELSRSIRRAPGQVYRGTRNLARTHRAGGTPQTVREKPSVFESFDVFEPQEGSRSSSRVRASGIRLG